MKLQKKHESQNFSDLELNCMKGNGEILCLIVIKVGIFQGILNYKGFLHPLHYLIITLR